MKTLPKEIYVKQEEDGDDHFLVAGEEPIDISGFGESVPAGRYVLQEEITLVNKTEVIPIGNL